MHDDLRPARRFALVTSLLFLPVFCLPLFLDPYRWAKALGWRDEAETDVGRYFGRCLGALATALSIEGLRAARDPKRHSGYFRIAELASWLLAAVHVRGALEGRQPPIEHAEIVGWSAAAIVARRVRPE